MPPPEPRRPGSPEAVASVERLLPRCTFGAGDDEIVCAVSGGADSLALLVLACATGRPVLAVHVDHGLRADSAADGEVVADAGARLGASVRIERVCVGPGPNLEARARAARLAALPSGAAMGHTADDQAETVLLNLLRGSGIDGLAGIRPGSGHPILGLRRAETHALCAASGLQPVHDPTNHDTRHLRNRIRHDLLPALATAAGRDLVPVLARQTQVLRGDADLLDLLAAELDPTDARALAAAPRPLASRAVRRWLADPYPPDGATVARVLDVAGGMAVACEVGGGRRVERSAQRLRLVATAT